MTGTDMTGTDMTTVLIADDQALVRVGLRKILESEPETTVTGEASDGRDAVAAARRLRPDVVLMDIRMPVMDGIEATRRIVQEALTNALKHAGRAHAAVSVRYGPDSLELEITDDGAGIQADVPGGGHGLTGIRERVTLYGGKFDASARLDGGFAVRVMLPLT